MTWSNRLSGEESATALINLAYVAGLVLAIGLLVLGIGLIRRRRTPLEG